MSRDTVRAPEDRRRRLAWFVVLVLFFGSVLNYIDRAVLGVVKPYLQRDLSLSNTEYGLAVNCFLLTYSAFYILGGRLADRIGYRLMFSVNVVFWSAAAALHALSRGLASLCLFRALLGIGEGGYYPAAIRCTSEWFGPENRAKAVGILLCGLTVGTLLTPPIVAVITQHWGWRGTFLFVGALGFLLVPPWLYLLRRLARLPRPAVEASASGTGSNGPSLKRVLWHRKYLGFLVARGVTDIVWLFYLFWMPGYFQEVRGFNLVQVGRLLWIPFFCADIGALGGAWASSGLVKRGWSVDRSRKLLLYASAGLGMSGAFAPFVSSSYGALAIVSLVLLAQLSWSSNVHTTITEIAPPKHVAILYGITGAAGNGTGALMQPLIGRLVDTHGYAPAFVATAFAYLVAIGCIIAAGRIEPIRGE